MDQIKREQRSSLGVITLLLAVSVVACLSGCGKKEDPAPVTPAPAPTTAMATPAPSNASAARYQQQLQQGNVVPGQRK